MALCRGGSSPLTDICNSEIMHNVKLNFESGYTGKYTQLYPTTIANFSADENLYKGLHQRMRPIIYNHRDRLVAAGKLNFDDSDMKFNANEHGFTSYYGPCLTRVQQFQPMISFIRQGILALAREICDYDFSLKMDNVWFTIYPKGHSIPRHSHPAAQFSGVYYFDVNEDSGPIYFEDPVGPFRLWYDAGKNPAKPFRPKETYKVDPETGMFLIFPSWLPHRTTSNKSDSDRIIFSYNFSLG